MTKLLEIINVENSRQENNDLTSIHLWREGSFYRMYNQSAWLIVAYCYNENLIKEGYKPLQITRKRIAGTDDTLCFVGFPLKSLLKFIPNAAGFQPNDDVHITIPISLQNTEMDFETFDLEYLTWFNLLPISEEKQKKSSLYNIKLTIVNKVYGEKGVYAPIRKDENRTIACYGYIEEEDGINATWYEIVFYNFNTPRLNFQMVKNAIIADINAQTDEKIINGYEWTILHGNDAGKTVKVWLSAENQNNFKAFHDAVKEYPGIDAFPVTYKLAEDENGNPIYETFENMGALSQFYLGIVSYIKQTVSEGWARKDSIDWSAYEQALNENEKDN